MNEQSLATEMLRELKENNKRLFNIVIILVLLWFATIIGFVWYINQYEVVTDDTYISTNSNDNNGDNSIEITGSLINGNN